MSTVKTARIVIVDDHIVFRESLAHALASTRAFEVQSCGTAHEALDLLKTSGCDLALLDFDLGSETALTLLRLLPTAGTVVPRVAVLTGGMTVRQARELVSFEIVRGIIVKDTSLFRLVETIEELLQGNSVFDSRYASALLAGSESELTAREGDVLRGLLEGLSNKEIAATLFISETTVKNTLQKLFCQYDVRTRGQLIRNALKNDIVK